MDFIQWIFIGILLAITWFAGARYGWRMGISDYFHTGELKEYRWKLWSAQDPADAATIIKEALK